MGHGDYRHGRCQHREAVEPANLVPRIRHPNRSPDMIRKAGRVLHIAVITLLALATAGTAALWVDSYRDRWAGLTPERKEIIEYLEELGYPGGHDPTAWIGLKVSYEPVPREIIRLRAYQGSISILYDSGFLCKLRQRTLPIWLLLIIFVAYPMLWLTTHGPLRRYRRRRRNQCVKCGYDLTGNVSGVCPECGHRTSPYRRGT